MPRISCHTLGCKLNYAETCTVEREFRRRGFESVPFGSAAEVTVINTCMVTASAERKCRSAIRQARRASPDAFLIVTGCYAQLKPRELAAIPGVDAVLGNQEKLRLFEVLDRFDQGETPRIAVSCTGDLRQFGPAYSASDRTRAFLKIQDGCDYKCSFCTIPRARGASRSHDLGATVAQAHEIATLGYKEIVLTGVNIGLYGRDRGGSLFDLVQALDRVEGIERFRISSIEPNLLSDALIDWVAAARRFVPHFHLPLQSGDDQVLRAMRRLYRREVYAERLERIQRLMPGACVGADVIVGFPAEDEQRFASAYAFLERLPLAYLHVFTYSERAGTAAVDQLQRFGRPVPQAQRERRSRQLRQLGEQKRRAFYRRHLGEVRTVLWEKPQPDGRCYGFTDNYIQVIAADGARRQGAIEPVCLEALTEDGIVAARSAVRG
jgi:threonylcarbamoyladenosine tRNA methylthiotransferase MtaB